jgi:hypothetical protein
MTPLKAGSKESTQMDNTFFLATHFYDKKTHLSGLWNRKIYPGISVLKQSIEIIKSKEYSPFYFRDKVLSSSNKSAPEFWKDLYWFICYEDRKNAIVDLIQMYKSDAQNNPFKNDLSAIRYYDDNINDLQEELSELNEIIKLSKELRTLINEVFPDLEKEFAQRLQRYEKKIERDWEVRKLKAERISNINSIIQHQSNSEPSQPPPDKDSDQLQNNIRLIDEAIEKMFPSISDAEKTRLKDNLEKKKSLYLSLDYIGTKKNLWKYLKQIRINGIDRNEIARVFSTYCKWKLTNISQPNELKYDEIYRKS